MDNNTVDGEAFASAASGVETRIGSIVDKYTIVRVLGQGGMGAVYEARHAKLARRFAIKFLLPDVAANAEVLRRFENEAKAAGGLEHPNLAAVTDFGRAADGSPYLVMEFLQGEDCAKLLRRLGPLPFYRATNIVLQSCRGLAVAHKAAIVHRDLKPENLFLTDAGDGSDLIKVLDFGIAKLQQSDASLATGTGSTFGTAYYMSPEQARGAGEVDQRADVWSLGVVLYELLSGHKPFEGEQFLHVIHQILSVDPPPLATLRSGLPPKLVTVVQRAMAKSVAERFPSVIAFADALAPFVREGASVAPPRRSQGASATIPTPATEGVGNPLDQSKSLVSSTVPIAAGPRTLNRLAIGITVSLAVAAIGIWTTRKGAHLVATTGPAQDSALRSRPPTLSGAGLAPVAVPTPPPVAALPPPGPTNVRTVSEHSRRDSDSRGAHAPSSPTPHVALPKALRSAGSPGGTHPISIEKSDPYDP